MKLRYKISAGIAAFLILSFSTVFIIRSEQFKNEIAATELSDSQLEELNTILHSQYEQRFETLHKLPYNISSANVSVLAESAILISASTGNILFEKNADEIIPPASMTKLFAMYVVDEEVSAGRLSYDQIIPLPPECWACNMPPHSSLMFLGEGQIVTLDELLFGLSICSGNDAAYALAYTICGSMEEFVARMNKIAVDCGLTHTHFVESSGYSEENTTTAREMAAFAKIYLEKHPESLQKYHSVPSFTYPKPKNMSPGDTYGPQDFSQGFPRHITMGITQQNTNPLIGRLAGCDGLKTGYIDESGYNLALTVIRGNTRYISVTMKGPGSNNREGQNGRIQDGTSLMEWAFSSFADYVYLKDLTPYFMKVYGAKNCKSVEIVPAFYINAINVPFVLGNNVSDNLENVKVIVDIPSRLEGEYEVGQKVGSIKYMISNYLLEEIPLVIDRKVEPSNIFIKLIDLLIK